MSILTEFIICCSVRKKGTKAVTRAVPFQKGTILYLKGAYWYHNCTNLYHEGTNMHPLGTKVIFKKQLLDCSY